MRGEGSLWPGLERGLARLAEPAPADFALRVLLRAGIPRERYDTYALLESPAGPLYAAYGPAAVTGAVLGSALPGAGAFEELHRARTGRAAIRADRAPDGLRAAVRTGRAERLPLDLSGCGVVERAVLTAVRMVPRGQLRPLSWIARESGVPERGRVLAALAGNPAQLLVPGHRVTDERGLPCGAGCPVGAGAALRRAEGIDPARALALAARGTVFLGSDATFVYCHPTCARALRTGGRRLVDFRCADQARQAGDRPCGACRPAAA